jgi:hypothetical protein
MKTKLALTAGIALAALTAACNGSTDSGLLTDNSTGQLNLQLTDAPFPFSQVKRVDVFVVRIDAKTADIDSAEAANESDSSGWKTLVSPNVSINLLDLAGGKTSNLGVATLPAGTYRGFRMIIDTDKSSVTLTDGSTPNVKWPSAGKNGLKIVLDQPVVVSGTQTLLLDFDVGRSFVMRGNSISQNGLLFRPVIRATTQQSTGILSGSVHADTPTGAGVAGATIEVLKSGSTLDDTNSTDVVRTGMTDASGNFTLSFLAPGTYVVRATPTTASGYKPALLTGNVTITAGATSSGNIIVVTK